MEETRARSSALAAPPRPVAARPSLWRQLPALARGLRPRQWAKNGLVYLAFVFSANQAWRPAAPDTWLPLVGKDTLAFALFCALAGAEYLFNDLRDIESDRLHPRKRHRPLASGELSPALAVAAALILAAAALAGGFAIEWRFGLALVVYAVVATTYSLALKHLVVLDILAVAAGFVVRAVAGALAIDVPVSPWLYMVTVLGALFISIYKRRHELLLLEDGAADHRPILAEYTVPLLDQMGSIVTASTVIAYALYTFTADNLPRNHAMMLTVPFVLYGVFRYLYLVYARGEGGNPEEVLLRDIPLLIDVALWLVASVVLLAAYRSG